MKILFKISLFAAAMFAFAACQPTDPTLIGFKADMDSIYSVKVNTQLSFSISVDVTNPKGNTSFTADNPEWLTLTSSENTATFTGTPTKVGSYDFLLTATNNKETVTKKIVVAVTLGEVARTILLEKFTGDQCVYCPWGAEDIDAGIQGNEDRVILVAHHVGYNEDKYTIAASRPLKFFYGSGGTYAPAAMIDRTVLRGSVPVMETQYVTKSRINAELAKPSYVKIDLQTTYDVATKELKVDVSGMLGNSYPNAKLNVYIIQEGLTGNQVGPVDADGNYVTQEQWAAGTTAYNGTLQNYNHAHALRATLTGDWGDALGTEIGEFSKSYTYTMPDNIKGVQNVNIPTDVNNMYVVAFVADYISNAAENRSKSIVHNAIIKKIIE